MFRKLLLFSAVAATAACIAAFVHAQDSESAPPTLQQVSGNEPLLRTPASPPLNQTADASTGRSSLADRLKAIRQNITNEYGSDAAGSTSSNRGSRSTTSRTRPGSSSRSVLRPTQTTPNSAPPALPAEITPLTPGELIPTQAPITSAPLTPSPVTSAPITSAPVTSGPLPNSPAARTSIPATPVPLESRTATVEPKASNAPGSLTASPLPSASDSNPVGSGIGKAPSATAPTATTPQIQVSEPPLRTARAPGYVTNNSATATNNSNVVTTSHGPLLRVETRGPKAISIRKEASYTISLANVGQHAGENVSVKVSIPKWVTLSHSEATAGTVQNDAQSGQLVWSVNHVGARQQANLVLKLVPQQAKPLQLGVNWSIAPKTSVSLVAVQEPKLNLVFNGPRDVPFGEQRVYTITVSNPGTGDAENVVVTLGRELGGRTVRVGTVAAGQQRQIEIPWTPATAGSIDLSANAVADAGLKTDALQNVVVRRAKLEIEAEGPKFKYAGSDATYKFRLRNTGDAFADSVQMGVAFPTGVKYLGGVNSHQAVPGGIRWVVGRLAPGAEQVYTLNCQLTSAGAIKLDVAAQAKSDLTAINSVQTQVEALADLKLTVNDPQGPHPVDELVEYEIKVSNRGTKAANNINVIAQFSDGIEPKEAEGVAAEIVPGQAIFRPILRLEAGAEVVIKLKAKALKAGNHVYRIELTCDDPESRRVMEGTTRFFGEDVRAAALPKPAPRATLGTPQPVPTTPTPATPPAAFPANGDFKPAPSVLSPPRQDTKAGDGSTFKLR